MEDTLLICTDCALWVANRDASGASEPWAAWLAGEGGEALAHLVVNVDEHYAFIPRPCEAGCPNTLAGERLGAIVAL